MNMVDQSKNNYSLEEVYEQLMQRDREDAEISKVNREKLLAKGLEPLGAKRFVTIHTDEIVGAENVAAQIIDYIEENDRVIAIEGLSGVGKGTTAHALKGELNGLVFSFGEVFRYLTFMEYVHNSLDHGKNLNEVYHELIDGNLHLFLNDENISQKLKHHLQDPYLSSQVPSVSCKTQDIVIKFFLRELERIKKLHNHKIIFEGRDYTLDFLPCDLRIELCAHPLIRAKRRLNQQLSL